MPPQMSHILCICCMCSGSQPACTAHGLGEIMLFATHYGGGGIHQCQGPKGSPLYMVVYSYLLGV
jgi:hypothetical protein